MTPRQTGRLRGALAALIVAALPCAVAAPNPATMDDEAYLAYLEAVSAEPGGEERIDTKRLAKLLFGLAATLNGGKANVRLLGNAISVRDLSDETVRGMIRERYRVYAGAVDRFHASVSGLLDRPDSRPLLYDTLMDGHEACWRLDVYSRLTETYGADASALVSILASSEACSSLRRAAFTRAVRDRIGRSLDDSGASAEELEILREEIRELERLVEDLRAIDER